MTKILKRIQKYTDLHRLLSGYPQAFTGKPEAVAMLEAFGILTVQLSRQVTGLTRPLTEVYLSKQELRNLFSDIFRRMSSLCIIIASRLNDVPLMAQLRQYRKQFRSAADLAKWQMALHISEILADKPDEALQLGVDAGKLDDFNKIINDFSTIIGDTNLALNTRRVDRSALNQLLKSTSNLLNNQCDQFVDVSRTDFPEMHASYRSLRRVRHKSKPVDPVETADITGTVTDAVTGLPVLAATISITEQASSTESDTDGVYIFDDLAAGKYTLNCFANGYQVPEKVKAEITDGQSLVINFSLTPVQEPEAN